jgi:hypothetical protein
MKRTALLTVLLAPLGWAATTHSAEAGPVFTDCGPSLGSWSTRQAAFGDIDGDGSPDVVTADEFTNIHLYLNDGAGNYATPVALTNPGERYRSVEVGDLDGDGDLDAFVTVDFGTDRVLFNDGLGNFTEASVPGGYRSLDATLADFDGDGDLDAFYVGFDQQNRVLINDGAGGFARNSQVVPYTCSRAAPGDIDLDGDVDLVLTCGGGTVRTRLWLNDGTGFFVDGGNVTPTNANSADLADLDGDGDLDIIGPSPHADLSNYSAVGIYLNDGAGSFTSNGQTLGYSTGSQLRYDLQSGDLDGDGDIDFIASMHQGDQRSEVFLNDGSGNFTQDVDNSLAANFTIFVALDDIDMDGDLDVWEATWNNAADRIYVDGLTCPEEAPVVVDTDGDGVNDDVDSCPAEDATGWDTDSDGCLDDSDSDGLTDDLDLCPAENATGWDTNDDGCLDDTDADGVTDDVDVCTGADSSGDTDSDGVCDDTDTDIDGDGVANGDDAFPTDATESVDTDGDGVGDVADQCEGDDATGDADLDGVCWDSEACDDDPAKIEVGVCGCGTADDDLDTDGITDCLEETLTLEADKSHVRWYGTRYRSRHSFYKNMSWADFTGSMELGGGLLAPDFRDDSGSGTGSVHVSFGSTSPVTVYDRDLTYDVRDTCSSSTSDNREKWQHKDHVKNADGKKFQASERAVLRFKNTMRYRSWNDGAMPAMSDTDNLGKVHSRWISADESRVRVRWNKRTDLPLTVTLNGVAMATLVDNGDNTYTIDSAYDTATVYKGNGTDRKRVIDIIYPDNLQEGDVLAWYSDADAAADEDGDGSNLDGFLYEHTLEETTSVDATADSVWYNAGGRFHVRVPIGQSIMDGLIDESTTEQSITVSIQVGDAANSVVDGEVVYNSYTTKPGHWRLEEVEEDTDGGSGGSGGTTRGTSCQTDDEDDDSDG